jgi:hypothetical protein
MLHDAYIARLISYRYSRSTNLQLRPHACMLSAYEKGFFYSASAEASEFRLIPEMGFLSEGYLYFSP